MASGSGSSLYLAVTGAPLTARASNGIQPARERGWNPAVIASESGTGWLDTAALGELDVPVLTDQREQATAKRLPPAAAALVAPATFNTINKLAVGVADTYLLSALCECLGTGTPMVLVPFVSTKLAGHPAWLASLAVLRYAGASLVDPRSGGTNTYHPIESGAGEQVADEFRWDWALDQLPSLTE